MTGPKFREIRSANPPGERAKRQTFNRKSSAIYCLAWRTLTSKGVRFPAKLALMQTLIGYVFPTLVAPLDDEQQGPH